ncbi:MAG TPA: M48 family metallopeptidase [Polyangium sp.]|nr:M48 family metallopeptidase [Polyangium sp.]
MAQVGTLDFKGFVEGRREQRAGGSQGGGHDYVYASDHAMRIAFEKMKPIELAVSAAVRFFKSAGKAELLGHGVKVGPRQFPKVHELATECAQTLGIPTPTVYIMNSAVVNAYTYGTNDDSFITIHSALVDRFTTEELRTVMGHECGHIHNNHVVYLTTMYYLTTMASIFVKWIFEPARLALNSWSRRAEVTCDRAGMLCSRSLDVSSAVFAKLALGSSKLISEMNMDEFLAQHEESRESVGRYRELFASHPWLPKRVLALRTFAESELYKRHVGVEGAGLSMEDVDSRVHEIIKVIG